MQYLNSERCWWTDSTRRRRAIDGRRRRQRRALERSDDAAQDLDEPGGSGIDDTGLGQRRQQLARAPDAVVSARDDRGEVAACLGLLRELADRR